jgi:D-alanyl-D-alanine carboxypeptidase
MTAGIFSYTADAAFQAAYDADPLMPFSLEDLLAILRRNPPAFPPGESAQYSDTNYYLLGLIVDQLTGQRVGAAIDQRIVQPLRLTGTSYPTTPDMPEPYAHGYNAEPSGTLRDVTRSNPGVAGAAGAMLSTLDDLRLWTEALTHGALLSPTMQRERLHWSAFPGGEALDYRYGLGIMAYDGFIGHSGGIAGYESMAFHLPEANATIVVLANKSGLFGGGAAVPIFFDIVNLLFPGRFPQLAATARIERPAPAVRLAVREFKTDPSTSTSARFTSSARTRVARRRLASSVARSWPHALGRVAHRGRSRPPYTAACSAQPGVLSTASAASRDPGQEQPRHYSIQPAVAAYDPPRGAAPAASASTRLLSKKRRGSASRAPGCSRKPSAFWMLRASTRSVAGKKAR